MKSQFAKGEFDFEVGESVRTVIAFPVRVMVQRFHRQHVSLWAHLTFESAQIGLTFGRIAASDAVAFKELIIAQNLPPLFGTCSIQLVVNSNTSRIVWPIWQKKKKKKFRTWSLEGTSFIHESTFALVNVTHEENLSSFDRNGCAGDHPEFVVDAVFDVGDAVVRQVRSGRRENTCETRFTTN